MGLVKFLKPVKCFFFSIAMGTVSHMTEAEYLKVNLPLLVLTCSRWKLSFGGISGVIGVNSCTGILRSGCQN